MRKQIGLCAIVLLLAGCNRIYELSSQPQTFHSTDKIDISVVLVLSPALYDSECKIQGAWNTTEYGDSVKIGNSLALNSETLAKAVFREVTVVRPGVKYTTPADSAILTVAVTNAEREMGYTTFSKVTSFLSLEWTLKTSDSQIIWVQETKGQGYSLYWGCNAKKEYLKGMQEAVTDVFHKSHAALISSPEIKAFAITRKK